MIQGIGFWRDRDKILHISRLRWRRDLSQHPRWQRFSTLQRVPCRHCDSYRYPGQPSDEAA